jgi:hypothetical protein
LVCTIRLVIDDGQFRSHGPTALSSQGQATRVVMARCSRPAAIDPRSADMRNKLTTQDVVVFGGLAAVFCWTYIVLPLAFYRG